MSAFVYKYQTVGLDGRYCWNVKSFKSQQELFSYLVNEREEIFAQRKSMVKRAEGTLSITMPTEHVEFSTNKAIKPVYENDKEAGVLKRTIVANTY